MKYNILITMSLFLLSNMEAQNNKKETQIDFTLEATIPSQKGNKLYFGQYWKEAAYALDSTMVASNGKAIFSINNKLLEGQYFLYTKSQFHIDLLIGNNDKNIKVFINEDDLSTKKVTGSKDSKILWDYLTVAQELTQKREEINDRKTPEDQLPDLNKKLEKFEKRYSDYKKKLSKQYKDTWAAAYLKGLEQIELPYPTPKSEEEAIQNRYYGKNHFFDNIDLADPRMWRTNYFTLYIDSYMKQWIEQIPDTLGAIASRLVTKTKNNDICFEEMLSKLTNNALSSIRMGDENIWVRLFEDHIRDKNISWIKDSQMAELKDIYERVKNNLIGRKGHNLNFTTIDGDRISTDEIQAKYLLLYFYDPDCEHCSTETPKLHDKLYKKYKDKGLVVLAINIASDIEACRKFINTYNLTDWINCIDSEYKSGYGKHYDISGIPMTYVLNEDKIIIAKKIDEENLDKFFNHIIGD